MIGILSCHDLVRAQYGVDVTEEESPAGLVVNIAGGVLLKNRPPRVAFLAINLSAAVIYIRPTGAASAARGIVMNPNGGFAFVNFRDDLILPAREWYASSTVDGSAIYVLETLIIPPAG
jgi:hypothetical protein